MVAERELVGRTAELAALQAGCEAARGGLAGVAIEGPPGIGKTAVWEAGQALAARAGLRVLACRAARPEAGLPFTALGDLLAPVQGDVGALPAPQARALRVALLLEDPGETPVDVRALGLALVALLRDAGPVALFVDDLQWLDPASEAVLAFALRRLAEAPVLLAATVRRERRDLPRPELLEALGPGALRVLDVGPLDRGGLHRLLRADLGRPPPRMLLARIEELSGGNPLYAIELARAVAAGTGTLPGTLRELVAHRVDGLPPRARDALAVVAAVPDPTPALVTGVVEDPDALAQARDGGAVVVEGDRVRLAHPLLAAAADGVASGRRRELHRRIAAVLADPVARASHLGRAAVPPDPQVAAELEAAAALAAARGAPLAAATLLERSLALLPRDEGARRAAVAIGAGRLHYTGGDERRGRAVLAQVRDELPPGAERADVLMVLAEIEDQTVEEALGLVRQALDEAGSDSRRRASLLLVEAEFVGVLMQLRRAAAGARQAVALAATTGDRALEADALSHLANLASPLAEEDPVPLLERAIALANDESGLDPWWRPRFSLERWHFYADELAVAARALEGRRAKALAGGDDQERHAVCLHLAELECRRGDLAAARRYADEGHDLTEQMGADLSRAGLLYARALVATHAGDTADARALAAEGLEICERIAFGWMRMQLRHVLGLVALGQGDLAGAAAELVPLMRELDSIGMWDPGMVPAHPDALEAAIGTGLLEEAAAWLGRYEEVGRRLDRPRALACGARCRGLLHAVQGDLPAALEALERALAEHERLPVPFERARTLLVLGTVQRRLKQRGAARTTLTEAAAAFDAIGSRAWAGRARSELARIGGRAPGGDGLTPTESRVAALVAAGRSNREAAAELFVSVRAIEANLSRIYAKLGVRSRTELAARLPREGGTP